MSRLKPYLVVLMLGCFGLLGPGWVVSDDAQGDDSLTGSPLKGRNIFVGKGCIQCHAVWGAGGHKGPDLARLGMRRSLLQVAGSLWNHSLEMDELMHRQGAAWPTFSPEEMRDFFSYLYYVNYFSEPGDATAGRRLFGEKGCGSCHSKETIGRAGNGPGSLSPLALAQAMWNHGPQMESRVKGRSFRRPFFRGREMADLLAFLGNGTSAKVPDEKFMLPGSPSLGQRLFTAKGCASCHAPGGRGVGPDLARGGLSQSLAEIAGEMWNHDQRMWARSRAAGVARPQLSGNDLADLIAYLAFIRSADRPGDARGGKRLFFQKGCANCHSAGQERQVALPLSQTGTLASASKLTAAMWNHVPKMGRAARAGGQPWPRFQGDEMRDLVEYLKSVAQLRGAGAGR